VQAKRRHGEVELDEVVDAALTASRVLVAMAARSLAAVEDEVTLAQYRALVVLRSRGPQPLQALAAELDVVPSTATRMADRLVAKGLIERSVPDDDRRQVLLGLTKDGAALVDRVTRVRRKELAAAIEAMPSAERSALVPALEAFAAAAGEVPDRAWDLGWA
jgi:DNA-binding MarR family transcriptional regulator